MKKKETIVMTKKSKMMIFFLSSKIYKGHVYKLAKPMGCGYALVEDVQFRTTLKWKTSSRLE